MNLQATFDITYGYIIDLKLYHVIHTVHGNTPFLRQKDREHTADVYEILVALSQRKKLPKKLQLYLKEYIRICDWFIFDGDMDMRDEGRWEMRELFNEIIPETHYILSA